MRCAAGVLEGISAGRRTAVTNRPPDRLGEKGHGMGSPQIQRDMRGTPTFACGTARFVYHTGVLRRTANFCRSVGWPA